MTDDMERALLERLMFVLMKQDVPNLDGIKNQFTLILSNYNVSAKEEAIAIWTEGKRVKMNTL